MGKRVRVLCGGVILVEGIFSVLLVKLDIWGLTPSRVYPALGLVFCMRAPAVESLAD